MDFFLKGDKVACMINNLGGTSVLEMSIIAREAIQQLGMKDVICRVLK